MYGSSSTESCECTVRVNLSTGPCADEFQVASDLSVNTGCVAFTGEVKRLEFNILDTSCNQRVDCAVGATMCIWDQETTQ